jgi:nucleotide-binding universal stress UspA family protein
VAQKILRGCLRPLLVVRSLEDPAPRIKRIVVPLDGALGSEATLPTRSICPLLWRRDRTAPRHGGVRRGSRRFEAAQLAHEGAEAMEAEFDVIEKSEPSIKFTRVFVEGDPATRILERVEKEPASIIAMGATAATGFSRWMFGSVSEKVLQAAKCPVLIAPPSRDITNPRYNPGGLWGPPLPGGGEDSRSYSLFLFQTPSPSIDGLPFGSSPVPGGFQFSSR